MKPPYFTSSATDAKSIVSDRSQMRTEEFEIVMAQEELHRFLWIPGYQGPYRFFNISEFPDLRFVGLSVSRPSIQPLSSGLVSFRRLRGAILVFLPSKCHSRNHPGNLPNRRPVLNAYFNRNTRSIKILAFKTAKAARISELI